MAAKKKSARKTATKRAGKTAKAKPKARGARSAAAKPRATAASGDVVYSDVLHQLRSSLVARLMR